MGDATCVTTLAVLSSSWLYPHRNLAQFKSHFTEKQTGSGLKYTLWAESFPSEHVSEGAGCQGQPEAASMIARTHLPASPSCLLGLCSPQPDSAPELPGKVVRTQKWTSGIKGLGAKPD